MCFHVGEERRCDCVSQLDFVIFTPLRLASVEKDLAKRRGNVSSFIEFCYFVSRTSKAVPVTEFRINNILPLK